MKLKIRRAWTPESQRDYVFRLIAAAPPPSIALLRSFAHWLEDECQRAAGTVGAHVYYARIFVGAACKRHATSGAKALRLVTAAEIENFFIHFAKANGAGARRMMQAALRSLLKFARAKGWVDEGVATSVPGVRRYRLAGLPRALPDADLKRLLTAINDEHLPLRDRAIVLLLACYGVRRGQVSNLRLDDINWRARTILFRPYKRGKALEHTMLPVIADTLVRYLRTERSSSDEDFVFLRQPAPHSQLSPSAVAFVVHKCMRWAGLQPRGPHSLRHAFACRQLRNHRSLKTIADLLGHRSLGSVAIYAKVDQPRLIEAAIDWPEVRS